MSVGLHRRRAVDIRALNPHSGGVRALRRDSYLRQLRDEEHGSIGSLAGDIVTLEIVRPAGERRWVVLSPRDPSVEVVVPSSGSQSFSPGERVAAAQTRSGLVIIADSVSGDRGKASLPAVNLSEVGDLLEVIEADPVEIDAGVETEVTFFGRGFRESPVDVFDPVIPDELVTDPDLLEDDPNWTVGVLTWISETEVTALVTAVAPGYLSVRPERGV